jgi:hypothetical protein
MYSPIFMDHSHSTDRDVEKIEMMRKNMSTIKTNVETLNSYSVKLKSFVLVLINRTKFLSIPYLFLDIVDLYHCTYQNDGRCCREQGYMVPIDPKASLLKF